VVKALVVYAHPCEDSFVAEVRRRALDGIARSGGSVDLIDLCAEGFDPRLTTAEHAAHRGDLSTKAVAAAVAPRLAACDTLVLVYPTWWSGQPAILKGWFERTWVNGVAYRFEGEGGPPKPALTNVRRVIVVTTHGSSKWINAIEGESGKRFVKRALRGSVGLRCRVEWLALYDIDRSTPVRRGRFLDKVSDRFAKLR
jgi:putative NADPH-quinone reductase